MAHNKPTNTTQLAVRDSWTNFFEKHFNVSPEYDYEEMDTHKLDHIYYNEIESDIYFGAGFARPIVDVITAFEIGDSFNIKIEGHESQDEIEKSVSELVERFYQAIVEADLCKNKYGYGYLGIDILGKPRAIHPDHIKVVPFPSNNNKFEKVIIKKKVKSLTKDEGFSGEREEIKKEVEEIITPQKFIIRTKLDNQSEFDEIRMRNPYGEVPVVKLDNFDRKPNKLHGRPEFYSALPFMDAYHQLFSKMISSLSYFSNPIPTVTGISGNIQEFMTEFFGVDPDASDEDIEDASRTLFEQTGMLFGSENVDYDYLLPESITDDMDTGLNLLYWLIVENTQVPEFLFGRAVRSANASVAEQWEPIIRKINLKWKYMKPRLIDFIRMLIKANVETLNQRKVKKLAGREQKPDETYQRLSMGDVDDLQITVQPAHILFSNKKHILNVIELLLDNNMVSKPSALMALGSNEFLPGSPQEELARAELDLVDKMDNEELLDALDFEDFSDEESDGMTSRERADRIRKAMRERQKEQKKSSNPTIDKAGNNGAAE